MQRVQQWYQIVKIPIRIVEVPIRIVEVPIGITDTKRRIIDTYVKLLRSLYTNTCKVFNNDTKLLKFLLVSQIPNIVS